MDTISKVRNPKRIVRTITWDELQSKVVKLALNIKAKCDYFHETAILDIYGLPRNGLIIAVMLSHMLDIPIITNKNDITPATLIVDDISDSGQTLSDILHNIAGMTATIFVRKGTKVIPFFYVEEIDKQWLKLPWEVE